jgi:predicted MPP superfamily phosphohydrolase
VPVARRRYLCGVVHDGNRTVVVSGGLGTSNAPLRVHAPPDLWLVTVGPAKR